MGNVKGLLQSKTIWSVLFMIAMAVGGQKVRAILGDEQNQLVIIDQIGMILGGLIALYGRVTAKHEIQGLVQPKE